MKSPSGLGNWIANFPFEGIPEVLIKQIQEEPTPPYDRYLGLSKWLNENPSIWNICLVTEDKRIIAFQYGNYDPLVQHLELIRLSIWHKLFRISPEFLKECMEAGKKLMVIMGAKKIFWISCHWKAILRKLPNDVKVMDNRVMEVL